MRMSFVKLMCRIGFNDLWAVVFGYEKFVTIHVVMHCQTAMCLLV